MKLFIYTKDMTKADSRGVFVPLNGTIEDVIDETRHHVELLQNIGDVVVEKSHIIYDFSDSGDDFFSEEVIEIKQNEELEETFFYQEIKNAILYEFKR